MEGLPAALFSLPLRSPDPGQRRGELAQASAGPGPLGLEVPGGGRCCFLPGPPRGAARKISPPVIPALTQDGGDAQRWTRSRSTEALAEKVAAGERTEGHGPAPASGAHVFVGHKKQPCPSRETEATGGALLRVQLVWAQPQVPRGSVGQPGAGTPLLPRPQRPRGQASRTPGQRMQGN